MFLNIHEHPWKSKLICGEYVIEQVVNTNTFCIYLVAKSICKVFIFLSWPDIVTGNVDGCPCGNSVDSRGYPRIFRGTSVDSHGNSMEIPGHSMDIPWKLRGWSSTQHGYPFGTPNPNPHPNSNANRNSKPKPKPVSHSVHWQNVQLT